MGTECIICFCIVSENLVWLAQKFDQLRVYCVEAFFQRVLQQECSHSRERYLIEMHQNQPNCLINARPHRRETK